jgi:hypothetical protein
MVLGAALWLGAVTAAETEWLACSFLSGKGAGQKVTGARIQSNGTIVLAANLEADAPKGKANRSLGGGGKGAIVLLSPDGRSLLAVVRVADEVKDLALDGKDQLYVAAGEAGLLKLDPAASKIVAKLSVGERCDRVDAAPDGHCVGGMCEGSGGRFAVFDPEGKKLGEFGGHHRTYDVCIDGATKTVVTCGYRVSRVAGRGVHIAGLKAWNCAGQVKWRAYDWVGDENSDRYINRPGDNLAHTRGYRVAIGGDGKLYAAFDCGGGRHMFRFSPFDLTQKVAIVRGDKFHDWYNTRGESKVFFARYDPATGRYLQGQQFCARLSNGRGSTVFVKEGAIEADEQGTAYLTGAASAHLPLSYMPPDTGDYRGGGFLLIMSPDFRKRLYCTRVHSGATVRAVGIRRTPEGTTIALGGDARPDDEFPPVNAIQPKPAEPRDDKKARESFFTVLRAR